MDNITLKKASFADIGSIIQVESKLTGSETCHAIIDKSEWVKELSKSIVYLIMHKGIVVGDASYELKDGGSAYISGLMVVPEFQKKGIGTAAMKVIMEELENRTRIELAVHPENEPALKLYKKLGFSIESQKENYFGDGQPRLIMAKTQS